MMLDCEEGTRGQQQNEYNCDGTESISNDITNRQKISSFAGQKLACPPNFRATTLNPYTYKPLEHWEPRPQFWYDIRAAHKGPTWPVGDPDDYRFTSLEPPPKEGNPILEALEVERPERYIPGEIYKNQFPKSPIEDLTGTSGCSYKWAPKNEKVFYSKFDPATLPPQPLFSDYLKELEIKHKDKVLPPDESYFKTLESFEELIIKNKFIRRTDMMEGDKNNNNNNLNAIARTTRPCCESQNYCKESKYVFRTDKECSCCNSKHV